MVQIPLPTPPGPRSHRPTMTLVQREKLPSRRPESIPSLSLVRLTLLYPPRCPHLHTCMPFNPRYPL
jgi:hypothetical protein